MDPASIQEAKYKTQSFFLQARDAFETSFAKIRREETAAYDVAIIKATLINDLAPKEKHVQTLIEACRSSNARENVDYIIQGLGKRLEENTKSWAATLKTLIVFHRLMRETDLAFQSELLQFTSHIGHTRFLRIDAFNDDTTKDTLAFSKFIRSYSVYLDERLELFRSTHFDPELQAGGVRATEVELGSLSFADLAGRQAGAQRLMSSLLELAPGEGAPQTSEISLMACSLALKELNSVYTRIMSGVQVVAKKTRELDRGDALLATALLKHVEALNERLRAFEGAVNQVPALQGIVTFPAVQELPKNALPALEGLISSLASGGQGGEAAAEPPALADLLGFQSFLTNTAAAASSMPSSAQPAPVSFDAFASFRGTAGTGPAKEDDPRVGGAEPGAAAAAGAEGGDGAAAQPVAPGLTDLLGFKSFLVKPDNATANAAAQQPPAAFDPFASCSGGTPAAGAGEQQQPHVEEAAKPATAPAPAGGKQEKHDSVEPKRAQSKPADASEAVEPSSTSIPSTPATPPTDVAAGGEEGPEKPSRKLTFGDGNPFSATTVTVEAVAAVEVRGLVPTAPEPAAEPAALPAVGAAADDAATETNAAAAAAAVSTEDSATETRTGGVAVAATADSATETAAAGAVTAAAAAPGGNPPAASSGAAKYSLKEPDPLDELSYELLGKPAAPPAKVPMREMAPKQEN